MAPGKALAEVVADLENDPGHVVVGVENLRRFLQETMDTAIDALDGRHFDIAPPVHRVEACIAPPGGAAAMYYTTPSEDFRRPGRTWYPTLGRERFPLWLEVTTAYHEGAPGHHLQLAQSCWLGERINPYLRSVGRVSGQIEGWAVYAERLMDELGLIEDPAYRLGMLACQAFRSARVVTDLGLHLGLRIPSGYPELAGERWGPAVALVVLRGAVARSEAFLRSEIERYLSWPAQAIGYKVGERIWRATREQVRQRAGAGFDLRAFHSAALKLGLVGLQQLQEELVGEPAQYERAMSEPCTVTAALARNVVSRVFEEVWNVGRVEVLAEVLTAEFVGHGADDETFDAGVLASRVRARRQALPDLHYDVLHYVVEVPWVATMWDRPRPAGRRRTGDGGREPERSHPLASRRRTHRRGLGARVRGSAGLGAPGGLIPRRRSELGSTVRTWKAASREGGSVIRTVLFLEPLEGESSRDRTILCQRRRARARLGHSGVRLGRASVTRGPDGPSDGDSVVDLSGGLPTLGRGPVARRERRARSLCLPGHRAAGWWGIVIRGEDYCRRRVSPC